MKQPILALAPRLVLSGVLFFSPFALAQKPAAPAGNAGGGATSGNTGNTNPGVSNSRGTFGNNNPRANPGDGYETVRPIFLSGSVIFDDGAPLNSDIRIVRICNGSAHPEAHTDSKGRFSFQLGGQMGAGLEFADVSSDGFNLPNQRSNGTGTFNSPSGSGSGLNSSRALMGCELRAEYPGYVSETVDLSMRHSMDDPKVGVIVLHRLVNVKGTTVSVVSAQAPRSAQKNYAKAMELAQKGKLEEALDRFSKATEEYPKYAVAWFDEGRVQQRLNRLDDAKASYLAAAAADSHYVSPYDALALLSAQQSKWEDAAKYSRTATDLNPVEFPSSFWYNALANYNLKNSAEAEKSARALAKLDGRHRYPETETMLAEFAAQRGELDDAAGHLRAYLTFSPSATNSEAVKKELARLDQARATQAKAAPAPQQ